MTEEETDRWISLFGQAISFADKSAIKSCEVLELLCCHIQNASYVILYASQSYMIYNVLFSPTTHLSRKIISALMSKLRLDGASNDIPTTFLTYIDDHLQLYPPDNGDAIYHYLETIRMLAVQLPQCPRGRVVSLLVLLTKGVCAWIYDRSEITSDTGYDDNVSGYKFLHMNVNSISLDRLLLFIAVLSTRSVRLPHLLKFYTLSTSFSLRHFKT